jgi:hypothetical protein
MSVKLGLSPYSKDFHCGYLEESAEKGVWK